MARENDVLDPVGSGPNWPDPYRYLDPILHSHKIKITKVLRIFPNTQMFKFVITNEDQGVKSYGTVQSSDKVSCCLSFVISSVRSRGPTYVLMRPDSDADPDQESKKSA